MATRVQGGPASDSEAAHLLAAAGWAYLFESLTSVDPTSLDQFLLHDKELPRELSAKQIRNRVAAFLNIRKGDADQLLGTSSSQLSRSDRVNTEILDRTYMLTRILEQIAAVIGTEDAKRWLREPNPGLEGEVPLNLLQTHYGCERVENLVDALLNGAIV